MTKFNKGDRVCWNALTQVPQDFTSYPKAPEGKVVETFGDGTIDVEDDAGNHYMFNEVFWEPAE